MCKFFEKIKDYQIILFAIILSLGLIIAVAIGTRNITQKGIYMTGSAAETVTADSATWSICINTKSPTLGGAYKQIQAQIPVVKKFLSDNGIDEKDISLEPASYWTQNKRLPNGNMTDEIAAYNYSQNIKVKSNDVQKIKKLSTDIEVLCEKGILINSQNPEYQYSKLADLKVQLLEKASQDAKQRANSTLKVNGNKTGRILSVKTGVFQITAPDSSSVSDMGINDSYTIDKKVTAVVNVTYEIK